MTVKNSETDLERFFSRVDQLVPLQLGALHEGLATLSTNVDTRTVGVEVFPHGCIVPKHLGATLHKN